MATRKKNALIYVLVSLILLTLWYKTLRPTKCPTPKFEFDDPEDFDCFDNEIGAPWYIVPNFVHFITWNKTFSFMDAVCVLAAFRNQKPDKLFIHGDRRGLSGKYWEIVMKEDGLKDVLQVKYLEVPTEIFGQTLNVWWKYWHGGDIARIKVLMEYGGIFLDGDSFLVRNLNEFRKFEMTIGWQEKYMRIANQCIVAHKNARFLRKWLNSYRHHYLAWNWYYNIGVRPVQTVLSKEPNLIHRVKNGFCEEELDYFLYLQNDDAWRQHYVIHLLSRYAMTDRLGRNLSRDATYPVEFDEINIARYNATIRQLVGSVIPIDTIQ